VLLPPVIERRLADFQFAADLGVFPPASACYKAAIICSSVCPFLATPSPSLAQLEAK
jgi:hypothetical protein